MPVKHLMHQSFINPAPHLQGRAGIMTSFCSALLLAQPAEDKLEVKILLLALPFTTKNIPGQLG